MEIKKTEAADLENKKSTSYLIGFVLVFALLFAAFEFTTYEKAEVIDTPIPPSHFSNSIYIIIEI